MTDYQDILVTHADRVTTITLNRPDRLNAWTRTMAIEVKDALRLDSNEAIVVYRRNQGEDSEKEDFLGV